MGQRRAGLQRVGMRRAGQAPSSGSSLTLNECWRKTGWYVPGLHEDLAATNPAMAFGAVTGSDNFLNTLPQTFRQAGTITALGITFGNPITGPGTASGSSSVVYRSSTTNPAQPGALAIEQQWAVGGFNAVQTAVVSISVAAGETLWFVSWTHNQASGGTINVTPANGPPALLGYDWDGTTNPGGVTFHSVIGYRSSLTYTGAAAPSTFPAINEATDLIKSNTPYSSIPTVAFQFTPS